MTTNNEAFEDWRKAMCIKPITPQEESNLSWAKSAMNYGIKSATTEANKRMAELESEHSIMRYWLHLNVHVMTTTNKRF